jgi:hypothetical protein
LSVMGVSFASVPLVTRIITLLLVSQRTIHWAACTQSEYTPVRSCCLVSECMAVCTA